jgi:hypothetical protein
MTIDDLSRRVAALEDRLALIELEATYARTFDNRDGAAWAALFLPDGVYQARGATPEKGNYVAGHDALADFCTNAPFDGLHLMHLPSFTIDGDDATGRLHLEFLGAFHAPGNPLTRMAGYYDVRYRRVEGLWRIAHRVTSTMRKEDAVSHPYPTGDGLTPG